MSSLALASIESLSGNPAITLHNSGVPLLNVPMFLTTRISTTQSLTSGTGSKVQLNSVVTDTHSWFDTNNNRYVPQIAGYYHVTGSVYVTGTNLTATQAIIYKNGTQVVPGPYITVAGQGGIASPITTYTFYMNGTTDYIELYALAIGTSPVINPTNNANFLTGFLVRGT